jgi:membrane-associated protein
MWHYMDFAINYVLHLNENLAIFASHYGVLVYAVLFLIVFCQTGIVVSAFLPGDSLLFASGVVAASGGLNVYFLIVMLIAATFFGYILNYWVGNLFGQWLFRNENSKIFRRSHLNKTHAFYEKYGGKTIIVACFVPIIRTFAPFVAGMAKMTHVKFIVFSFIGAVFWVTLLTYGSYLFGNIPFVKNNFSLIIVAIIIVSLMPPFVEYARVKLFHKLRKDAA